MNPQSSSSYAQAVSSPSGSPVKGPPIDELAKHISPSPHSLINSCEMMAGILSYAERTAPGVSSRLLASDLLALTSGLLHASGMSGHVRRVNVCSPAIVTSVLQASGITAGKQRVTPIAKKGVKAPRQTDRKSAAQGKSLNLSKGSKSSQGKTSSSKGDQSKKAIKPFSQTGNSRTEAEVRRSRLRRNALTCYKRLSKEAKDLPSSWDDSVDQGGAVHSMNSRCAYIAKSKVSSDDVRKAVDRMTDDQIAKKPDGISPLVFIGIIPSSSVEADLLANRSAGRMPKAPGVSDNGSSSAQQKGKSPVAAQPAAPPSGAPKVQPVGPSGGKQSSPKVSTPTGDRFARLSYSLFRVSGRYVEPKKDDNFIKKLTSLCHGLNTSHDHIRGSTPDVHDNLIEKLSVYGPTGFSFGEGVTHLPNSPAMGIIRSPKGNVCSLIATIPKEPLPGQPRTPNKLIFVHPGTPEMVEEAFRRCADPGDQASDTLMGLFPRSKGSQARVTSSQSQSSVPEQSGTGATPNRKQGPRASSDVFSDLFSESLNRR